MATCYHSGLNRKFSRLKDLVLFISFFTIVYLCRRPSSRLTINIQGTSPTARNHLFFSVASSSTSFHRRTPYMRLWYTPNSTRAVAFLDRLMPDYSQDSSVPSVVLSGDTSRFPYSCKGGLRSAIRVARVVKETVYLNETGVRWFVFGDDDTVFFVENIVETLSRYDHNEWLYIGSNSESYEQNNKHSFDMAFGGGGFAISYSLGRVLADVLDSCLIRYAHLYGSDARIFSCVAELGISLTREPGFHQIDMRGNLFGFLSSHPRSPLLSLHHVDTVDPLFPGMSKTEALRHLFKAVNADPAQILQHIVCYDRRNGLSVSIAWGYAIQVFEGNQLLPALISRQRTFTPWTRVANTDSSRFMFNTREYPRDPCSRPSVFFMDSIINSNENETWGDYSKLSSVNCPRKKYIKSLMHIRVSSKKGQHITRQNRSRRQCAYVAPSSNESSMVIIIRQCGIKELISMHA